MPIIRRRFLAFLAIAAVVYGPQLRAQSLPDRLSDKEFWKLVTDISEPGGYFRSDNYVSNETFFQTVIPTLLDAHITGDVYLGVGPDQNFTYIAALKPKMAFIFDIRAQNVSHHLMYKAMLELSADRADFLSLLFDRPRPAGLSATVSADSLFHAFAGVASDSLLYKKNHDAIVDLLVNKHGFALSDELRKKLDDVIWAFYTAGPDITYNFGTGGGGGGGGYGGRGMPTYAQIQMLDDGHGLDRAYMGSDGAFRAIKELEGKNLLVPVVGDFAGPKAIRAVGVYLKEHNATVSIFYTSNVEQYLFQDPQNWRNYYESVATLPLTDKSTFIRSGFNGAGGGGGGGRGRGRSSSLTASMQELLKAYKEGHITQYYDVLQLSH
jgi:hypothetical protein